MKTTRTDAWSIVARMRTTILLFLVIMISITQMVMDATLNVKWNLDLCAMEDILEAVTPV